MFVEMINDLFGSMAIVWIIVGALILCLSIFLLFKFFYLVQQSEVVIIERFGRFDRILGPGLHFIVPFMDRARYVHWTYFVYDEVNKRYTPLLRSFNRIDLRESVYDFPRQSVITKDNVTMEVNALMYYQITDPKAAVYEVFNLPEAIEKLTQTTLRDLIGSMDLDETLGSRELINKKLRIILDEVSNKWGVKVNRVELQEVKPPQDIRQAMEKQMRAERDRRAIILDAEGTKRAAILEAEGVQESVVLRAQGDAQAKVLAAQAEAEARLKIADAEAKAIEMIKKAAGSADPLPYMVAINYIKTLPELTSGKNDKLVIVPYEATALTGSVAMIKKIFESAQ